MAYEEPEFLPWDGRRVPLTFVAGYLGAGKTTAINEVLATTDRPIAVIVNDVGEVNVDASLIRRRTGDTIELTDGCVCCSSIDGFGAAFDRIRARPEPPDHVIVELSGVAEPANVVPWGSSAGLVLDGVVTVTAVDQLLDAETLGSVRLHLDAQIAEADLVVMTHTDLTTDGDVARARRRVDALTADGVPCIDVGFGRRQPGALGRLLGLGGHHGGRPAAVSGPTLFDLHDTHHVAIDRGIERNRLDRLLADLDAIVDAPIARAKGVIEISGGAQLLVQRAGRRTTVVELTDTERVDPADLSGLVVITVPDRIDR